MLTDEEKKDVGVEPESSETVETSETIETVETIEIEEPVEVDYEQLEKIKETVVKDERKTLQFYEKLRKKLSDRMPKDGIMVKLSDHLFLLPDFFMLLCRLMIDSRVDMKTKSFVLGVIGYVILPIDIIPDFIPVIGFVDDLIIVVFALDQILKHTDEQVLIDNWSGKADLILTIKKILAVVDSTVGQKLLMKIKVFLFKARV